MVVKEGSTGRLWLQFVPTDGPAGEHEAARRITEKVRELGLQPGVVQRIEQAVTDALRKARQWGMRDHQRPAMSIQVWILAPATVDLLQSSSEARGTRVQKPSGWGFFLVQRTEGESRTPEIESPRVIELWLYQESRPVTTDAAATGLGA